MFKKMFASVLVSFVLFVSHAFPAPAVDIQSPLVELLQSVVQGFQALDYHTSKELVIAIPGVDQEIYFDLDASGSGDLFEPLPSTHAKIRAKRDQHSTNIGNDATTGDKFAELGKAFVKNELLKRSKNSEFMKWILENTEISPIKLFVVKEILLLMDSAKKQDFDQLKIETMCLLFRLSLTKDFGILDKEKPLTSHLPKEVRETLGKELCAFIDQTWVTVVRSMNNQTIKDMFDEKKNAGLAVHTVICRDETLANDIVQKFKTYQGTDFQNVVTDFVTDNNYQVVANKDFALDATDESEEGHFANKLVTLRSFGGMNGQEALSALPSHVTELVEKNSQFPQVKLVKIHGEYWVCYLSDRRTLVDMGKLGLVAMVQVLKKYAAQRQEYAKTHSAEMKQQRKQREQDALMQQKINAFLTTDAGKASIQRIAKAMEQLEAEAVSNSVVDVQDLQAGLVQAKQDLDGLNLTLFAKRKNVEKLQQQTGRIDQLQAVIDDLNKDIKNVQQRIADKQAQIRTFEVHLKKMAHDSKMPQLVELKKDLHELQLIVTDQQRHGGTASQEVLNEIAGLKKEIAALEVKTDTLDHRLALRLKQAAVYEQEAKIMQQELEAGLAKIESIKDVNKRRRETCKFSHFKNFYNLYIKDLEAKTAMIKKQNELIKELKVWREELRGKKTDDIAKDDLEHIAHLEREVGFLLDNKQYDAFIFKFMNQRPEVRDFLAECSNDKSPLYQEVMDIFSVVFKQPGHIQENLLLYRDTVRVFLPGLLTLFDRVTGFSDKTYGLLG